MKQVQLPVSIFKMSLLVAAFSIGSCNSSGNNEETDESTVIKRTDTTEQATSNDPNLKTLHTVKMTRQNFIDLFQSHSSDNNIKMVYFDLDIVSSGHYSLRAHGASENGVRETSDYDLQVVQEGRTMQFIPGDHGYSQQITRGNVKGFLGLTTGTNVPIDQEAFKDEIWLSPCTMRDENGETLIYFRITEPADVEPCPNEPTTNARGAINTNPSPPAKPCADTGCEEILFKKKYNKQDLFKKPDTK